MKHTRPLNKVYVLTDNMYRYKKNFVNDRTSFCNINVIHNNRNMISYKSKKKIEDAMLRLEKRENINFSDLNYHIQLWSLEECLSYCDYLNLDLIIK